MVLFAHHAAMTIVAFPLISLVMVSAFSEEASVATDRPASHAREDIRIRDPFVLVEDGCYYLYGTMKVPNGLGFDAYRSTDLERWEGPFPAMRPPSGFWADRQFWAPEVHVYRGKYYLFATYAREYPVRGTQIASSESPLGPFVLLGDGPQTPRHWQCLDGTLYMDAEDRPWMVFCHEWTQVGDGEIAAIRLREDLTKSIGEPRVLFRASAASWGGVSKHETFEGRVTDGPFLHRTKDGTLLMLWSTFNRKRDYCVAVARSESGTLDGPWVHAPQPFIADDAGHPMLFRTHAGKRMLSVHCPNRHPKERPRFIEVTEEKLLAATRPQNDTAAVIKLMDTPLRDTSICLEPGNIYYMTGTIPPFWEFNKGIKLWKSADLVHWEPLGMVWTYGESPWHKKFLEAKKPLWAPEIHYLKGTFWLTRRKKPGEPGPWARCPCNALRLPCAGGAPASGAGADGPSHGEDLLAEPVA